MSTNSSLNLETIFSIVEPMSTGCCNSCMYLAQVIYMAHGAASGQCTGQPSLRHPLAAVLMAVSCYKNGIIICRPGAGELSLDYVLFTAVSR